MVPSGWKLSTVEEIASVSSGGTPSRNNDTYWNGNIPWVTTSEVQFKTIKDTSEKITAEGLANSSAKLFPVDTILMAMYGQGKTRGQVAKLGIEASTNQACAAIVLHPGYEVDYYYQFLVSQYENIREMANKGGQENLSGGIVKSIQVPIPPLPEQRKIAAILSTWDKAISTTEQLLANSQQQKKALMQQLLTGKKRLLDENGERFRGEWKCSKVSDLLKVRKERQVPTQDIPLFSLTIEDGITPKSDRYNREFLVKNTDEKKYKLVNPKDIVYNPANLRWGAINFSRIDHSVVVSPIYEVLFLKDENKTSLEFIAQKLMTPDQIGRFAAMVEGTLVERMAVKIEPFLATKLSVPPTLKEQQKIASVLTVADEEISALQQKIETLKQEKKALMQQLLTGKLRVKVDEVAA